MPYSSLSEDYEAYVDSRSSSTTPSEYEPEEETQYADLSEEQLKERRKTFYRYGWDSHLEEVESEMESRDMYVGKRSVL